MARISFGEQLRSHRLAAGLSQAELAERAGLTAGAIGALERGQRRHPYPHTVRTLAAALALPEAARTALMTAARPEAPWPEPAPAAASPRLPRYLTTLTGREAETAVALRLLQRPDVRLLTLTGPGGVGKTRRAVRVAAAAAADFPDGTIFVPLASLRDPALVLPAIAHAAGVPERTGSSLLSALVGSLETKSALLVLDNFEHLTMAAPRVSALLLASPALKALVTSRARLRVAGEQEYRVPPLELPSPTGPATVAALAAVPAVALFVERAQAADPAFALTPDNAPIVVGVCRRLDGLPLAIELAAARLSHLPLDTLHERLERRLQLLTGGATDLPPRLRTLRNAIAWSVDLLTLPQKAVFGSLAVFVEGFTLGAAEVVAGPPAAASGGASSGADARVESSNFAVLDALMTLVDHSLVQYNPAVHDGPRYGMLETVREFALELLMRDGEPGAARQAHAEYYLAFAELARPPGQRIPGLGVIDRGVTGSLDRLEAEHPNLRAALSWYEASGQGSQLARLATALGWFWDYRGYYVEGRDWLQRALDATQADGAPLALRADAAQLLGLVAARQGAYDHAERAFELAKEMYEKSRDSAGFARVVGWLGTIAEYRGDEEQAQRRYEEALSLFRQIRHPAGVAVMLNDLADTAYRRGDLAKAEALAQELLSTRHPAPRSGPMAGGLVTAAEIATARGEVARAVELLREALGIARELDSQVVLADVLLGLADVAAASGDAPRAAHLLAVADRLSAQVGCAKLPHHALFPRARGAAREALGESAFAAAWSAGAAMPLEEAIAEASLVSGARPTGRAEQLTPREVEVLQLVAAGMTDRQIADALFIGPRTVESHVAHAFAKLGVHTRASAIAAAIGAGLIEPTDPLAVPTE